eukprot:EG_transcript_25285
MAHHHNHHFLGGALGAAGGFEVAEHNGAGLLGDLAGAGIGGVAGGMAEQGLYNQFEGQQGNAGYGGAPPEHHHHKLGNLAGGVAGFEAGDKLGGGFLGELAGAAVGAWGGGALEEKFRDRPGGY